MATRDDSTRGPIEVNAADVFCASRPYHLTEQEFLRLTRIQSYLPIWAHTLSAGAFIFAVSVIVDYYFGPDGSTAVSTADWIKLGIVVAVATILELINWLSPGERKKMERKIEKHFDEYAEIKTFLKQDVGHDRP